MKKIKIGIISPANNVLNIFPNRTKTGIDNLNDINIDVLFSSNAFRKNSYSKVSVNERLNEINEILDKDVDLIMASMGGYTSIQLLDKLDYEKIKKRNISFCGFSDITSLLLAIYAKTKIEMLYGPVYTVNLCDYGGIDKYTKDSILDVIHGEKIEYIPSNYSINEYIDWNDLETKKIYKKQVPKNDDWTIVNEGKSSGELIGGNLATLLLILGTEYLPISLFKNKILFLEDCDTNILEFTSYMESLRLKGVLDLVKGIIVGKFDSKEMNESIEAFLKDYLINYDIPVICNVDFGHVFPILTLPIGRMAKLECFNNEIKFIVNKKNRG